LAFFSARDGRHAEADLLFRSAIARKIRMMTSNLVLAEVHRLLLFRAGIRPAAAALEQIDLSPSVKVEHADEEIHRQARAWLGRLGDQILSYTDASSFALMKSLRCDTALSFDRDFEVAGFALWRG
jgi:predicted nucleic acid-binding protein